MDYNSAKDFFQKQSRTDKPITRNFVLPKKTIPEPKHHEPEPEPDLSTVADRIKIFDRPKVSTKNTDTVPRNINHSIKHQTTQTSLIENHIDEDEEEEEAQIDPKTRLQNLIQKFNNPITLTNAKSKLEGTGTDLKISKNQERFDFDQEDDVREEKEVHPQMRSVYVDVGNEETSILFEELEASLINNIPFRNHNPERIYKLKNTLKEILDSEKSYREILKLVVESYKVFIEERLSSPEDLKKCSLLFGNIEDIYRASTDFIRDLSKCIYNPEKVSRTFIQYEYMFKLYPIFMRNRKNLNLIMKEEPFAKILEACQIYLMDKLNLSSYLMTPVQRICKYELLFRDILNILAKENLPQEAIKMANKLVTTQAMISNQIDQLDAIKNCPFNVIDKGPFLLRNKLSVSWQGYKEEYEVFLFREHIIATSTTGDSFKQNFVLNLSECTYSQGKRKKEFHVIWFKANKPTVQYRFSSNSDKTIEKWLEVVGQILNQQVEVEKQKVKEKYYSSQPRISDPNNNETDDHDHEHDSVPEKEFYDKLNEKFESGTIFKENPNEQLHKLFNILKELYKTERHYNSQLVKIVDDYLPHIYKLVKEEDRPKFYFLNEILTSNTRLFLQLQKHQFNVREIALIFINNQSYLQLYTSYVRSNDAALQILEQLKPYLRIPDKRLEENLHIDMDLNLPVQRICKYQLILEKLIRILKKLKYPCGTVQRAYEVVYNYAKICNTLNTLDNIRYCPFSLMDQGVIKLKDDFLVTRCGQTLKLTVFLFQQYLLFTFKEKAEYDFVYNSINCLKLEECRLLKDNGNNRLLMVDTENNSEYALEAKDDLTKRDWESVLEKLIKEAANNKRKHNRR